MEIFSRFHLLISDHANFMTDRQIPFLILLIVAATAALLSGCATSRDSQQNAQNGASATQDASPTVSGYISVGASKKF